MNQLSEGQPSAPESSFAVEYRSIASGESNPDLSGRGILVIPEGAAIFRFSGRSRNFLVPKHKEIQFTAADITNVATDNTVVRFSTELGRAGNLRKPFVFLCRDSDDAAAVAALLPKTVDPDFVATRRFQETLRQLSGSRHPWLTVTNLIIAVNVIVFLIMAGVLGGGWIDVPDLTPYMRFGANNAAATTSGEWWRLIASMFLHFGIAHLAFNMWALFEVGALVEKLQGRLLYIVTYFAAGIGGGFLSLVWHGDKIWSVGASGAIFGVYGALLGYMARERTAIPRPVLRPLMKSTLIFAGYNLFYGFAHPEIDNAAHIGGLVTGFLFGLLCSLPLEVSLRRPLLGKRLGLAAILLVAIVGSGIAWSPRYPHEFHDEMAWQAFVTDLAARESPLVSRQNAAIQRLKQQGDNAYDLASLDETEIAPFYADSAQKLKNLGLENGSLTDRRRQLLLKILNLKKDGLNHQALGLRTNSRSEIEISLQLEAQAKALGSKFQDIK